MKNRALIPLAIGLAVGLIAVKYSVDVVKKARAASSEDTVRVVVAQQMIPMGVEIKSSMLTLSKASRALAPQGCFDDVKKLEGRVVRTQIPKGVPVIEEMLAAPGTPAGMASLVPAGYRAVAVRVDEYSSVGGFLKPGCRVDVAAVMSVKSPGAGPQTISRVILQDVMVGAVGQNLTGEGDSTAANISRSVTLLVKPDEVPVLHLAATQGQIRLALRHYEDGSASTAFATENELAPDEMKQKTETTGLLSGLAKLLGRPQEAGAPKPAWALKAEEKARPAEVKPAFTMTILSGDSAQSVTFENATSARRVDGRLPLVAVGGQVPGAAAAPDPGAEAEAENDRTWRAPEGE